MRRLYFGRQSVPIGIIAEVFGDMTHIEAPDTGLQVPVWLPETRDDSEISWRAREVEPEITPLSNLTFTRRMPPAPRLGFGNFTSEAMREAAGRLRQVLAEYAATRQRAADTRASG